MMDDETWLFSLINRDNFLLHDFIERVAIILDSVESPTYEQISAARMQAFKEVVR